jgi:hypothetical protein
MRAMLRLWYIASGPWALQRYFESVQVFDGTFAIRDTWRNIRRPLFQDYTWQGRVIGVLLRLGRIGAGLVCYVLAAFVFIVAYLLWLVLPVIFVAAIIGGLFGPAPTPVTITSL